MTTFGITKVYTSKNGQPHTPAIGEPYTLTVEFDVTGSPRNGYQVLFSMANQSNCVQISDLTPGHKVRSYSFNLALDGEIPWQVDVDPFQLADAADPTKSPVPLHISDMHTSNPPTRSANLLLSALANVAMAFPVSSKKGSFSPTPPPTAIDFYDPFWLIATQASFSSFSPGRIDRLTLMMGAPNTDSWQKVLSSVCRVGWGGGDELIPSSQVEGPTMSRVFLFDRSNVPNADFSMICQSVLEVRNQRVDMAKLRQATWAELDGLQGIPYFKTYMSPEAVIESNHKKITDFVLQTLGANYRNNMTPYDAARKLFQAVLARTVYYYPPAGVPDKRPLTAVGTLDAGLGDCGDFSMLLVALYRNIGFPARTACCAWIGEDAGHCWCEMWFPDAGWMVSDGSVGNGQCEDGSFAFYFGNIPDLHRRYANMRGNTFTIGNVSTSWLQSPYGPLVSGTAQPTTNAHTGVIKIDQSSAMSLAHLPQPAAPMAGSSTQMDARSMAAMNCPCASHGGFMARNQPLARIIPAAVRRPTQVLAQLDKVRKTRKQVRPGRVPDSH